MNASTRFKTPLSRRRCLQAAAGAVLAPWCRVDASLSPSEEKAIASIAEAYLRESKAPGLSVAFAKGGQLVYTRAFGWAEAATGEKVTPEHLFRIASVSKPITSAAIHLLVEQGKLKLEDKAFALLELDLGKAASPAVRDITVHHLLTHTCGGWGNKTNDPMFQHAEMSHAELIAHTLATRALENEPGKAYAYSNFGYCVLGRVIEKITGKSYAGHVQAAVLTPCGIHDMRIAGNTLAERAPLEVVYGTPPNQNPYTMNVRRMDSHGGWIATPADLVRFLIHVDGFDTPKDLLKAATLKAMTTATAANPGYASGFAVNNARNWWHAGSLPGTDTIAVRTHSGLCWAGFTNARANPKATTLDSLMWKIARAVPEWRA